MKDRKLSMFEAYKAMYIFIEYEYELTKSDDIGDLLSSMSLLVSNNYPVDQAMGESWEKAVDAVLNGDPEVDVYLRFR